MITVAVVLCPSVPTHVAFDLDQTDSVWDLVLKGDKGGQLNTTGSTW